MKSNYHNEEKNDENKVVFNLTIKQALAYIILIEKNNYSEIGYGGGAGGGKSFLGCFWILKQCLEYPGTSWFIGRKELTNLKKTTLITFFKVLESLNIDPQKILNLNSQTNIINFENGSIIYLMDTAYQPSDPLFTRFGSLELTGAFVDESQETSQTAIEILNSRIGRQKNQEYELSPKLLETFNPSKTHIYYRYYKPYKDNNLPKHRIFIPALVTDNPYIDSNYIEQLKKADKITKERLLYGNFDYEDDPAKLFEYDSILDVFTNAKQTSKDKFLVCDVARFGSDYTVVIYWKGLHMEKIWIYEKQGTNVTRKILEEICENKGIQRSHVIIDEDGLGGGVVDEMDGVKGFINNSRPLETQQTKKKHNFANLKSQCYFYLADYVSKGLLSCYKALNEKAKSMIIEDLEQIKQKDPDKEKSLRVISKEEIKEHLGRSTDFGDAMAMRMYFCIRPPYKPYIAK